MPRKPKRPCSYQSCPRLCEGRFCKEHEKLENKNYEKYKRNPDVRKRYGSVWRKIRESYVKVHPFCEVCFKEGRMKRVEEVHHIKPLSEGGTHHKDNLISLCQSCHARIHAKNGSRWNKNRA